MCHFLPLLTTTTTHQFGDQLEIKRDNSKMVGGMSNVDSGSDPLTTDSNQSEKSAASNPDGKVGQKQIAQDAISHPK